MKFLQIFGFLLLLLSGNPGNATAFVLEYDLSDENLIAAEISEDIQEQLHSTLTTPPAFDNNPFSGNSYGLNFLFRSQFKTGQAELYIDWSRWIDPSLGVSEIIFPFHSFL